MLSEKTVLMKLCPTLSTRKIMHQSRVPSRDDETAIQGVRLSDFKQNNLVFNQNSDLNSLIGSELINRV